jgi:hypothetical protein
MLTVMLSGSHAAFASSADSSPNRIPLTCPKSGGYISGPFAGTKATAEKIFLAIRGEVAPQYKGSNSSSVRADDKGDYWSVYQIKLMRTDRKSPPIAMANGLSLEIDKCSGAVKSAAFVR